MQVPFWHESVCVHALPSLQLVPFITVGFVHIPVPVLHVPAVWHWSLAVQELAVQPEHVPPKQLTPLGQTFPQVPQLLLSVFRFVHVLALPQAA